MHYDNDDSDTRRDDAIVLEVPDPGPDYPYGELDDAYAEALLAANGISISERQLIEATRAGHPLLRAAAAHVLGARRITGGILALLEMGRHEADLLRAEAGFALARMDIEEGVEILRASLDAAGTSIGAVVAAGFLAREGDPSGFRVVKQALADPDLTVRIVGARQLWWFVPFEDVDEWELFATALADRAPHARTEAIVQLRQIDHPRAAELLREAGA